jgi:hypothetical protein
VRGGHQQRRRLERVRPARRVERIAQVVPARRERDAGIEDPAHGGDPAGREMRGVAALQVEVRDRQRDDAQARLGDEREHRFEALRRERAEPDAVARRDALLQPAREHLLCHVDDVQLRVGEGHVGLLVGVQVHRQAVPLGDVEQTGDLAVRVGGEVRAATDHVDAAGGGLRQHRVRDVGAGEQADLQRHAAAQPLAHGDQGVHTTHGITGARHVDVGADGRDAARDVAAHGGQRPRGDVDGVDRGQERPPLLDRGDEVVARAGRIGPRRRQRLVEVRVRLGGGRQHSPAGGVEIHPRVGCRPGTGGDQTVCHPQIRHRAVEQSHVAQRAQKQARHVRGAVRRTDPVCSFPVDGDLLD